MRLPIAVLLVWVAGTGARLRAEEPAVPPYLADRGPGISTSQFGTYVEKNELLVYAFYEYTKTTGFEYKPRELGSVGDQDFFGTTLEHEYLLFLCYGLSDRLAVEFETALHAETTFEKTANDPSSVPARFRESGLGDVDMQLRWRWKAEAAHRPELYSFFEITPPLQKSKRLIGTQSWEGALGFGVVRGYRWGTITGRAALAYDGEDAKVELGEYAFEYLKRVSARWRFVGTLEGEGDEVALIGEAQWFFNPRALLKLNCGFGLTQRAPDIAPEVGVLFRF